VEGFDPATLQKELSSPLAALQAQPIEALRSHVQRLADLHFVLEMAVDVSPAERRVLSERILTRVGQVGLLIRQRTAEPLAAAKGRGLAATDPGPPAAGDLADVILGNSGLLVRLLGGLLIAFALGSLAGYRRAARAVCASGQRDPRTQARALVQVRQSGEGPPDHPGRHPRDPGRGAQGSVADGRQDCALAWTAVPGAGAGGARDPRKVEGHGDTVWKGATPSNRS
jgi:hypothetical protein